MPPTLLHTSQLASKIKSGATSGNLFVFNGESSFAICDLYAFIKSNSIRGAKLRQNDEKIKYIWLILYDFSARYAGKEILDLPLLRMRKQDIIRIGTAQGGEKEAGLRSFD
ncbi:MAG: hypothetical protein IKS80_05320 [Bacteroidaceae bacterium]|nr:hypothetical protein [Bacteroidaceae bacterium]